jgi:hypothetical protein
VARSIPLFTTTSTWLGLILSATVVAALITSAINLWLARRKSREEERARIRNICAEAYQACADYKEFPYAIRRRDAAKPAEERVRISEALRIVQSRLSYYETWTTLEAPMIGAAYADLVRHVRITAGGAMHAAWTEPGTADDSGMNIPPGLVDLSSLRPYEEAYRSAVSAHLRQLAPRWS